MLFGTSSKMFLDNDAFLADVGGQVEVIKPRQHFLKISLGEGREGVSTLFIKRTKRKQHKKQTFLSFGGGGGVPEALQYLR